MMEIVVLKEIAQWLGREEDLSKLAKLEEIQQSKSYFMTFWGHYSAGKSKLINCILDRDILPIQNRETTAVLTYIQYGVEEGCRVIYNDGSYLDKKIESVKEIFQNTEDCEELRKINHLEIFVNDELLKKGLVLVDTPGANTLIQQHQILAAEAIEQSGKIVYVLGNSPSKIDMEFIKQISDCGIDILFVRTKCDKINPDEEDILEALNKEKEEVESHLNKKVMFISVSNEKNSEWNQNIKEVRRILNEASDSLSEELEVALDMRLQVYMKKYKEELIEICQEIKNTLEGNEQLLDEKIGKYNGEVERLSNVENEIEEKIENKINQSKKLVKNDIEEFVDKKVDSFRVFLETVENSPNYSKDVEKQYRNYLINAIGKIQEIINGYFETIVKEENDALKATLISQKKEYVELAKSIKKIVCSISGNDYIDYEDNLLENGLDSLLLSQISGRIVSDIQEAQGMRFDEILRASLTMPTIMGIAQYISDCKNPSKNQMHSNAGNQTRNSYTVVYIFGDNENEIRDVLIEKLSASNISCKRVGGQEIIERCHEDISVKKKYIIAFSEMASLCITKASELLGENIIINRIFLINPSKAKESDLYLGDISIIDGNSVAIKSWEKAVLGNVREFESNSNDIFDIIMRELENDK